MENKHKFIRLDKISKNYISKKNILEVLQNISFSIYKGEIFSLLGVNGAGKTTLSSIISTLINKTSGDIIYNNTSIYDQLADYRQIISFCPQSQNLNSQLTVEENLIFEGKFYGLTKKQSKERSNGLIEKFNLEKYVNKTIEVLSGGYKQRLLIARTLMHDPKLIILDEPTAGVDPKVREVLWTIIRQLKNDGIAVLLTTHYLDEAEQLSDRICLIDQGVIKVIDSPQALMEKLQKKNLQEIFLHLIEEGEEKI